MKKIQNKGIIVLMICALIVALGFPFYKKYYIIPREWKKTLYYGTKKRFSELPDSLILKCCDCVYDNFKSKYGVVENFPNRKNYTKQDKISVIDCTIKYLVTDSVKKEIARAKMDSMANQL